jgi:hypothetical protein
MSTSSNSPAKQFLAPRYSDGTVNYMQVSACGKEEEQNMQEFLDSMEAIDVVKVANDVITQGAWLELEGITVDDSWEKFEELCRRYADPLTVSPLVDIFAAARQQVGISSETIEETIEFTVVNGKPGTEHETFMKFAWAVSHLAIAIA